MPCASFESRRRLRQPALATALLVAALLTDVAVATAQPAVGKPFSTGHRVLGSTVTIIFNPDDNWCAGADAIGSATLFAAYSPGGPIIARQPFLPAFCLPSGRGRDFVFPGVPPATYYVVMVFGTVAQPNPAQVTASDWDRVNVFGGCSGPPGYGLVLNNSASAPPGTLELFLGTSDGCATTFDIEAGTSPGGTDVLQTTHLGESITAVNPPAGRYYVRARGRNAAGVGGFSRIEPVSIPPCAAGQTPAGASSVAVSRSGSTLTLTWTRSTAPPGVPVTYQEIGLWHQRANGQQPPTILLPAGISSVSGSVPPGTYEFEIRSGNACGSVGSAHVTVTVP